MSITPTNPFKGRQFPGEVILQAGRWYLQYPLLPAYIPDCPNNDYSLTPAAL